MIKTLEGSFDGSRDIGAPAIVITDNYKFANNIKKVKGKITQVKVQGSGGRIITNNIYTQTNNQPMDLNYPLMTSCTRNTPVRLFVQKNRTITYAGLFECEQFVYQKTANKKKNPKTFTYTLVPYKI
jgi:hypothetical protein